MHITNRESCSGDGASVSKCVFIDNHDRGRTTFVNDCAIDLIKRPAKLAHRSRVFYHQVQHGTVVNHQKSARIRADD